MLKHAILTSKNNIYKTESITKMYLLLLFDLKI